METLDILVPSSFFSGSINKPQPTCSTLYPSLGFQSRKERGSRGISTQQDRGKTPLMPDLTETSSGLCNSPNRVRLTFLARELITA